MPQPSIDNSPVGQLISPDDVELLTDGGEGRVPAQTVQGTGLPSAAPASHVGSPSPAIRGPAHGESRGSNISLAGADDGLSMVRLANPSPGQPRSSSAASPAEAAAMSASIPRGGPTLAELDQSLADDADALLYGEFQSVDDVLEGVFEQKAAIVQEPASRARAPLPVDAAGASQTGASAHHERPPVAIINEVVKAAVQPAPSPAGAHQAAPPIVRLPKEPANLPDFSPAPNLGPAPLPIAFAPAEAQIEAPPSTADKYPDDDALEERGFAAGEMETLGERNLSIALADGPGEEVERVKGRNPALRPLTVLTRAATGGPIGLLMLINYPLRFAPPSSRRAVDWIAITLLAWVPLVWGLPPLLGWGAHHHAHRPPSALDGLHTAEPTPQSETAAASPPDLNLHP